MDSLLAIYASSDEEDENLQQGSQKHQQQQVQPLNSTKSSGFFSSLSPAKSYPFLSLPPPKSQSKTSTKPVRKQEEEDDIQITNKPSSLFSSLPQPKSASSSILPNPLSSSDPKPKRVVQFRPPVNPFSVKSNTVDKDDEDEEDEDDDEKEKQRKKCESLPQTPSVKSFLSTIPAPKNTTSLGVLGSGAGRRSTIDADVPVPNSCSSNTQTEVLADSNTGYNENQHVDGSSMSSMGGFAGTEGEYSNWCSQGYVNQEGYAGYGNDGVSDYGNYAEYGGSYGTYADYGNSDHNWTDGSSAIAAPVIPQSAEATLRFPRKRGRNDAPQEIVEVNQDELMKNRPREDQTRLTGIAFGPSYQPASTKGKPSKLHKRKHQIGSLYFDMKQKEMELGERRSRGMLTKAQTQGKYGW